MSIEKFLNEVMQDAIRSTATERMIRARRDQWSLLLQTGGRGFCADEKDVVGSIV